VVDITGAGDALVAGLMYGLYNKYSLLKSVQIGLTLSNLTVMSPESVYSKVNERLIKNKIVRMFKIL